MKRTVLLLVVLSTFFVLSIAALSGQATPHRNVSITAPELSIVSLSPLLSGDCDPVVGDALNGNVDDTSLTGNSCRISLCEYAYSKDLEVLRI